MKTNIEERNIEQSGNFAESQFTIKASRKAFKILSDSLYSDKIKAIIRELSCNAYDAHVDANNLDTPFDIHLPSTLEPIFYIRDYGIGLSRDQVENLYTTYFASTKTESNDVVGCLGLGSKSPFSYTTMFTVTSYYKGVKYVFNAMLNADGFPSIMLINESPTDEHNGLKIEFAVNHVDHYAFSRKAEDIFSYFSVKPKFVGASIDVSPVEYTTFVDGVYGVRSEVGWRNTVKAVMGNVAYPITLDKCGLSSREFNFLKNVSVDMFFKIGELDVAASREGLSYDARTIKSIKNHIVNIIQSQLRDLRDGIKSKPSYWDAVNWYVARRKEDSLVRYISEISDFSYGGKELNSNIVLKTNEYKMIDDDFSITIYTIKSRWNRAKNTYLPCISSATTYARNDMPLSPSNSYIFFNDCTSCHKMRVKKYVSDNDLKEGIVVLVKCTDNFKSKIVSKLASDLMVSSVRNLSEITVEKIKRSTAKNVNIKSLQGDMFFWSGRACRNSDCWQVMNEHYTDDFESNGGIVIDINRWLPNVNNFLPKNSEYFFDSYADSLSLLNEIVAVMKHEDGNMPSVYGVKSSKYAKFIKLPNVTPFAVYAEKFFKKFFKKHDMELKEYYVNDFMNAFSTHKPLLSFFADNYKKINSDALLNLVDLYLPYKKCKKKIVGRDIVIKLMKKMFKVKSRKKVLDDNYEDVVFNIKDSKKTLCDLYPYYSVVAESWSYRSKGSVMSDVLDYINWKSSVVECKTLTACEVNEVGVKEKKIEITSCI